MAKAKLQIGDRVTLSGAILPNILHPNGDAKPPLRKHKYGAKVVIIQDVPGKTIGVELDSPGDNLKWSNAHECDGDAPMGFGWWITAEEILAE